eukprot:5447092-Pleurochrysis_carterae.AAC.1
MPPSPAWPTMSSSCQRISAAAARSAALSIWRRPGNSVCRSDRRTGAQSLGSVQSHTTPQAHFANSACSMTTVGTSGTSTSSPAARRRRAWTAASADANHPCTLPA